MNYRVEPSWQREINTNKKLVSDPLSVIYNEGQWRLNKLSPLHNLQYDAVKLKQYSAKIRQSIVSLVSSNASLKYSVKIEPMPHLKYSEEDADGLRITITSTEDKNKKTKECYEAILLSWGVSVKLTDTTHLPYMLERGEQKLGTAVKSSMQNMFDCNIRTFSFTQGQILQLAFSLLEQDSSRGNEPFGLTYKTPQVDHKDKLNLYFDIEDVKLIWNGAKKEVANESELVSFAYQILQMQIFHMVTLDITILDLCEISLPKAEVKCSGIVKMKTPEMVNCVFLLLNSINNLQWEEVQSIDSNSVDSNLE